MLNSKNISLVLPCRNEEGELKSLLPHIPKYIDEVIVVDNNSTDRSANVAKKLGAKVITEKRTINGIGYGFAISTGLNRSKGDYIVVMDADDTYSLGSVKKIINRMEGKNLDFVSCARRRTKRTNNATHRVCGAWALTTAFNILFQKNIKDILSGMWVVKSTALPHLNLEPGDWNLSISIKASAILNQYVNFAEITTQYKDRVVNGSKQKLLITGWNHGLFLLNIWLRQFKFLFDENINKVSVRQS